MKKPVLLFLVVGLMLVLALTAYAKTGELSNAPYHQKAGACLSCHADVATKSPMHKGMAEATCVGACHQLPKAAAAPAPAPKPAPAPAPKPAPAPAPAPVAPAGPVLAKVDFKLFGANGKVDVAVVDGDVYVGIRSAAQAVGANVSFDAATKQVVAKATYKLNNTYAFELKARQGQKGVSVNGTSYLMAKPVVNVNGNLYVHAHSIAKVASDRSGKSLTVTLVRNVLELK